MPDRQPSEAHVGIALDVLLWLYERTDSTAADRDEISHVRFLLDEATDG